jgi:hypothetical protein
VPARLDLLAKSQRSDKERIQRQRCVYPFESLTAPAGSQELIGGRQMSLEGLDV